MFRLLRGPAPTPFVAIQLTMELVHATIFGILTNETSNYIIYDGKKQGNVFES